MFVIGIGIEAKMEPVTIIAVFFLVLNSTLDGVGNVGARALSLTGATWLEVTRRR